MKFVDEAQKDKMEAVCDAFSLPRLQKDDQKFIEEYCQLVGALASHMATRLRNPHDSDCAHADQPVLSLPPAATLEAMVDQHAKFDMMPECPCGRPEREELRKEELHQLQVQLLRGQQQRIELELELLQLDKRIKLQQLLALEAKTQE
ncbi:hypothetical protein HPB47_026842 [Ixodes persulcatus]|uniref:Uncharacterized protein n=1 Tax=Ixodes persulcatus TaxID=34615 RepID=A0AC60PXN2_IXOPE|nr:hypothetical protein HPB47_026842 [Ixodes persulcatus]